MHASLPRHLRSLAAGSASVFVAFAVTYLTWPLLQLTPMAFFYAAVVAATLVGGVEGGRLAVALSAVSAYYAFFLPYWAVGTEPTQLVILAVFCLVASAFVTLIARQKRAAAREKEQHRWFSATLSSVGDAVIATDPEGRITFMNDVAERLTGWRVKDAAGRELEEVFSIFKEGTRERTESPVKKALETGHIVGLANHTTLVSKDGHETAIEDSAAPIRDDEGTLRGVILVFRDASEKRRAELAAEEAHKRAEDLLQSITDGFFAVDHDWLVTYVNPQFERILGQKPRDVLGKSLWDIYPGLSESEFGRVYRRVAETGISGSATAYYEHFRRWYELQAYPARDGIMVFFRDVTSRVEAEEENRRLDGRRRLALDAAGLGSWNMNPATEELETDERFRAIFGVRGDRISYRDAVGLIHPEDRDRVREAVAAATRAVFV